jgi:hypothetical protein
VEVLYTSARAVPPAVCYGLRSRPDEITRVSPFPPCVTFTSFLGASLGLVGALQGRRAGRGPQNGRLAPPP